MLSKYDLISVDRC